MRSIVSRSAFAAALCAGVAMVGASMYGLVGVDADLQRSTAAARQFERTLPVAYERAVPGAGLGLSIVRAVADAHGARLDLAPRAGGGLVAEVTFPSDARAGLRAVAPVRDPQRRALVRDVDRPLELPHRRG